MFTENIYLCTAKTSRCRVLLVGQVTTLSLSKQGFESPTRYQERGIYFALFFYYICENKTLKNEKIIIPYLSLLDDKLSQCTKRNVDLQV